jgi:hypothetical protein
MLTPEESNTKYLELKQQREERQKFAKEHLYERYPEAFKSATARWRAKNPQYQRRYIRKIQLEVQRVIGKTCIICGLSRNIHYHEIYGRDHPRSELTKLHYILNHSQDFVPLCRRHHYVLHRLIFKTPSTINLEKFLSLAQTLKENKIKTLKAKQPR